MKNERTVYTTCGCFPFILFSSCKRKNENGYNRSYFYFSFFVWGLEKRKRMLSYTFSIFYYEIEKRKTKGRYIHGPLSPDRRQAIIWTNAGLLLIEPLGTTFSEILIELLTFSFKKMRSKVSSAKWRPFCLSLNVLIMGNCYPLGNYGPDASLTSFDVWWSKLCLHR